jgi:hypothetical protein
MAPDPESIPPDDGHLPESRFGFERALRTAGFEPADDAEAQDLHHQILINESDFVLLADHHQGENSYAVLYDSAATWDIPGTANLLAIHVARDPASRTFRYSAQRMPLVSLSQQWLVARGCPPEAIVFPPGLASEPADQATVELETTLRSSPGRYTLVDHYTYDSEPYESWALLRDSDPASAGAPLRLFLETADIRAGTYTLREGAFVAEDSAHTWLEEREGPLPPPLTARPGTPARPAVIPPPPPPPPGPRR